MNKKSYLISVGCFLIGLLLGVGGTCIYGLASWGKKMADGLVMIREIEIVESGQRAMEAYRLEGRAVAIYALSQYLDALKKAEEMANDNPAFLTKCDINFDTMLAHARLAKAYAEAGQSDLCAQHVAEAIRRASLDSKLQTITNQTMLTELLTRLDKKAVK